MKKQKLLLHTCCAPCSGFLTKQLSYDFDVTIYFDNSNIYPEKEFLIRKKEAQNFFTSQDIKFIETEYNHDVWLEEIKGLEQEPERGKRCKLCYYTRLKNTAQFAKEGGFDCFASTLAISPHKDADILNNLGRALEKEMRIKFLEGDWKKKEGFKQAMEFSHSHDFYHQNYCGCEFSQ